MLEKIHLPNWLVGVLALTLILRIPSFFEPYYYGDEMIYLTLGQGIRQGLELYTQIFDNKPPLIYLTAAIAGNLFWFKAILAFWNMAAIVVFWKLANKLLKNGVVIATLIFALATTLPTLEGNTVNAELLMILPSLLAFYYLFSKNLTPRVLIFSGFLFSLATLFKIPAAFDVPIVVFYWLITRQKSWLKNSFILSLGFATPILLTFVWFFLNGALPEYFRAVFLQNVGYLGSLPPPIDIPFGIRALAVLIGLAILYLLREKLSKSFILFCLWTLFTLFAATLSQRPYPHYLIQATPALAFLFAMFFTNKTREQAFVVIPLTLIFFVPYFYKYYDYKILPYYARFINYATGQMDKNSYFTTFSEYTPRNYKIGEFLMMSLIKNERVFIWDPDSPVIYALSRRLPPLKFSVPYHVYDYSNREETAQGLTQNPPKFIILTSKNPYPEIMDLVRQKYILIAQLEDATIYSRLSESTF